jgi:hypothetical protein
VALELQSFAVGMPFLTHSHTPQLIALFSDGARRVFGAILRILKNGKVRPKSDLKKVGSRGFSRG